VISALHAIDQADIALQTAGLAADDVFRAELRDARMAVAELIETASKAADTWPATAILCGMNAALKKAKGDA
jgi:hypothetical protein